VKLSPTLEEFELYGNEPFEDDLCSPMEVMFQEASSAADEDTQPVTDEEAGLAKVPIMKIEELTGAFCSMRENLLADRVPLLKKVWYDFENDCPHLSFTLRYPLAVEALSVETLSSIRGEVEELGDILAPLFGQRIAISIALQ
jgi:hypothetical protein